MGIAVRLSAAVLVLVAFAGCGSAAGSPSDDATPSVADVDASPPDVVLTRYLDALVAGDCERTRSFVTATYGQKGDLCERVDVLGFTPLSEPAHPTETEYVYSTTLSTEGSDDGSIPAGNQLFFWQLLRQPDGTWLVNGGGSGP